MGYDCGDLPLKPDYVISITYFYLTNKKKAVTKFMEVGIDWAQSRRSPQLQVSDSLDRPFI